MVIALRDDVLDEVNQLFYERRSIVLQLRTLADPGDAADAVKLALRAAELAAGLDAWTGGAGSATGSCAVRPHNTEMRLLESLTRSHPSGFSPAAAANIHSSPLSERILHA